MTDPNSNEIRVPCVRDFNEVDPRINHSVSEFKTKFSTKRKLFSRGFGRSEFDNVFLTVKKLVKILISEEKWTVIKTKRGVHLM